MRKTYLSPSMDIVNLRTANSTMVLVLSAINESMQDKNSIENPIFQKEIDFD